MRGATLAVLLAAVTFAVAGPHVSFVQGYSFDPLDREPDIPVYLRAAEQDGGGEYHIVQFRGPVLEEWKAAAEDAGAELLAYVHQYAFIARLPEGAAEAVEALPGVRWVGPYHPAYKLFPGLAEAYGAQTLIVVFFEGEDGYRLLNELAGLGAYNLHPEFNEWNRSVKLDVDGSRIADVARLPGVAWVEPYGEITPDNRDMQWVDQHGYSSSDTTRTIWARNLTGQYLFVGLTDTQLWMGHDAFRDTLNNTPGPSHRKVIHYAGSQGANSHGTHTGGTLCGNDEHVGGTSLHDGLAKDARLYFQYYSAFPSGWDMNVWFAGPESGVGGMRALNHSMSLSRKDTFNTYIFSDMTADQFIWNHRNFTHCNSMGNYGINKMGHPVSAKNIISVGATRNGTLCRQIYASTSRGPTLDGRMKPQLVSPGENIISSYNTGTSVYTAMSGTSMATPNMTASLALIRQYFRMGHYPTGDTATGLKLEVSAALNKAVAIVGADNDVSGYTVPDNNVGWGRIDLDSSLYFAGDTSSLWVEDEIFGLETGDSALYPVEVLGGEKPFRVALCWSDYPGVMQAALILVNDLDLTVISPTGTEYKGNVYALGQSDTAGIYDTLNVEECFRLDEPETGTWTVRVDARNVPEGPQPFALAAIGVLEETQVRDVGAVAITQPTGEVDSATVITPRAVVENFGATAETLDVLFTIDTIYADTQSVMLAAGGVDTVDFADWTADTLGVFVSRCRTLLLGDMNPANDMVEDSFEVVTAGGVAEGQGLPGAYFMDKGRPNPFAGRTAIRYGLPLSTRVELAVYSVAGTRVRTLASGVQPAGYFNASWDGLDNAGRRVSRGVYYMRLKAERFSAVNKLVKVE